MGIYQRQLEINVQSLSLGSSHPRIFQIHQISLQLDFQIDAHDPLTNNYSFSIARLLEL